MPVSLIVCPVGCPLPLFEVEQRKRNQNTVPSSAIDIINEFLEHYELPARVTDDGKIESRLPMPKEIQSFIEKVKELLADDDKIVSIKPEMDIPQAAWPWFAKAVAVASKQARVIVVTTNGVLASVIADAVPAEKLRIFYAMIVQGHLVVCPVDLEMLAKNAVTLEDLVLMKPMDALKLLRCMPS